MTKKGFTLAEVLVVIAILSIIGLIAVTIFTRTLRGVNKSQIISTLKQNGQSVLENIDKTVRNADAVICPPVIPPATKATDNTLVVRKEGIYIRYRFIASTQSVNGMIQQDEPDRQDVAGSNPLRKETDPEFVTRVCLVTDPMSNPVVLTDTNLQTGISVENVGNGLFTREKNAGFMDQLTIKFDLTPGKQAPAVVSGQIDPVTFQTTIQLR